MSKCKKSLCLLFTFLLMLASISTAFFAEAEESAAGSPVLPLRVAVEMSRSAYFVTSKAKATITVQNTGAEALKNVTVSAFSGKHLLCSGESCLLLSELPAGESKAFSFEMALDRKNAGVSFIERILLFFAQLFRPYTQMQAIPSIGDTAFTQDIPFRHGSVNATLTVNAWAQTDTLDDPVRPQVTYLDKYVTEILESGNFTLQIEQKEEGRTAPITLYENDDNLAVEVTLTDLIMQDLELPSALSGIGKVRFIITEKRSAQPKAYIVWTGGYTEMEKTDEITDMIRNMQNAQDISQVIQDGLEYIGATSGIGYICEAYKNTEQNVRNDFYFAKTSDYEGVVRWDQIDLTTGETLSQTAMRLSRGVTNAKAFKVEGRKISMEEFEKMFNG